jgi:uncharacterized protein
VEKHSNLPSDFVASLDQRMDSLLKDFPVDEVVQVEIQVYQRHFTKRDIEALVAFYSTPTGEKYIKETPAINEEVMQASAPILEKLAAGAMQRFQDEVAQAEKASDAKPTKKQVQN